MEQQTYTQVIDQKTGEIKYVPVNPPKPKAEPKPTNKREKFKECEGRKLSPDVNTDFERSVHGLNETDEDSLLTDILDRLIVNAKKLRYDRRLTNGKLDGRRLVAFKTSDRLFKKKAIKFRKYRFTFLIDTSGSMLGDKMNLTTQAVIKMTKSLEKLNIPVSIIGMNLETRLLKDFGESFDYDEFKERMRLNVAYESVDEEESIHGYLCGGTSESVAYKGTVKYLRNTRRGEEDVLFVFSDGEPGGEGDCTRVSMSTDPEKYELVDYDYKENSIDALKSFWKGVGDITKVYGLGIMSTARQVPNARPLNDVKELPTVLSHLIQDILI